jgi:hydrogenase expression/formation protein HypE
VNEYIKLVEGDGGKHTKKLMEEIFYPNFYNELLLEKGDAAVFPLGNDRVAYTTDSFVVKPIFFPGGNIGKLAVCGTVNDLIVSGANPVALSAGFIIEEGFERSKLETIVSTMELMCKLAQVSIVTGDTKVVEKGDIDGIIINTSGIGIMQSHFKIKTLEPGDQIIVTGGIGEHGTTIAIKRYGMNITGDYKSDCALLTPFIHVIHKYEHVIKIMRDPTRGGIATTLHEFLEQYGYSICLYEEKIPVKASIKAVNEMLGFDPLYMACEGRMVLVVKKEYAEEILKALMEKEEGRDACIIGEVVEEDEKLVYSKNYYGGKRIISELEGIMLPRIC